MKQQELAKMLGNDPAFTKINDQAQKRKDSQGNYHPIKYVPISHIQTTMDEVFGALGWGFEMKDIKIVGNELLGMMILTVYCPITGREIKRSGTAAVMIRQKSGAENTDVNAKLKNALAMDAGHLQAECIKSACKTLGRAFGRDLNREFDDTYEPENSVPDVVDVEKLIKNCNTIDELKAVKEQYPDKVKNPIAYAAFMKRYNELSPKQLPQPEQKEVEIKEPIKITINGETA
jgi:hypothetical protein